MTPRGASPTPWPTAKDELRYWSICDDLAPAPTPVVVNTMSGHHVDEGCRNDTQVRVINGYYTIVVGSESQSGLAGRRVRPAASAIAGRSSVP